MLRKHDVFVGTDNPFQRSARLLQAVWRERQGLPIGEHRGRPLGSRLVMPDAKTHLTNYLTENIRSVVRREVLDRKKGADKLFGQPRIFNDLLSSQPLCFNLFSELALDIPLASRVFSDLTGGKVERVTGVEFEHSPGRGDARYTGDRSAFDVFVEYTTGTRRGFLGIEVKYHAGLGDPAAKHRARYDEIAAKRGCFYLLIAAGNSNLMTTELKATLADHAAGNYRVMMNLSDELLVTAVDVLVRRWHRCGV